MNKRAPRDNLRERGVTNAKQTAGTRLGRTGSGRNSGPQNASPSTTSLKSLQGLYANQHFVHVASVSRGCTAELQVKSGKKFEGILSTFSPNGEVELRLAHPVASTDSSAIPAREDVADKMVFKAGSIVRIDIKDIDMDFASRGADAFQTDGEISGRKQNGQVTERELEAFDIGSLGDGPGGLGDDSLSGTSERWSAEDMFRKNEQMGVRSSYDSNLGEYTTPLEHKDTEEYIKKMRRAERLARQIEGSSEYMGRINKELECSEEDRFSAVVRPGSSSNSPSASNMNESHNTGKYVPPARRNKQGGEGLSSPGAGGPHRNHNRGTPPSGMVMSSGGGGGGPRPQSPHMHQVPSPQQQGPPHHIGPSSSPHGMAPPRDPRDPRGQAPTPPHLHNPARSPGMPMGMQTPQQVGHPRSPTGMPQQPSQLPPQPQRVPVGRRAAPDMVQQGAGLPKSPMQAGVPPLIPGQVVPPQANGVDKSRDGAGPHDVDKKTAPSFDRSPRSSIADPAKRQTLDNLKQFGSNFQLQDKEKAGPPSQTPAATGSPLAQQNVPATSNPSSAAPTAAQSPQQKQQPPGTTMPASATAAPSTTAAPVTPLSVASSSSAPSAVTSSTATTIAPTSVTPSTSTTATVVKPDDKSVNPNPADKKEDAAMESVKKSTLNPNAKEFNPMAKPFVPAAARMAQKTPTPPRPPSQPSPALGPQVIPSQYSQMSQPIYQIPVQQPGLQYPIRAMQQRKGATNLPQLRGHQDIHHILPVSMAAGQPLVAPMPAAAMMSYQAHQQAAAAGGPVVSSQAQPISHSQVISQQQQMPYIYPQKVTQRLAGQQNMVAAQQGGHGQHQLSQDAPLMVFPHAQMIPAGMSAFQHSGNLPISSQGAPMPTPYHQVHQPQPQPQPQHQHPQHQHQHQHHQNPTVHIQHQPPHQHQGHQPGHPQSHPSHPSQHPHTHQHTTPPLAAHTPQGQAPQGGVLQQQQQQPGTPHGARPSPSPVGQVLHQASQQQQHQQQQQQQQQQQFHPQGMQGMGQPQNHPMMAAMAAASHQGGGGTGGSPHTHSGSNHSQQQQQQQQQQSMMQHLHPQVIQAYQQHPAAHPSNNLTNVTPVHTSPHPHPKTVFLSSTQGQHVGAGPGGQPSIQAIPMHSQHSIMPTPVQGPFVTPQGQLHQAQVQQYQQNN